MTLKIRKPNRRARPIQVVRMPQVQSVHGRHCICHRCARSA